MSAAKRQSLVGLVKQLRMSEHRDVMLTLQRQYRDRLVKALRNLSACCLPPTRPSRDGIDRTLWPSAIELQELDLAVVDLLMQEREKPPSPFWKAYEVVNNRSPGIGLTSKLNALVNRANQRLKEAESVVQRLGRKAFANGPGAPEALEAQRLLKAMLAIQEDASNAGKIKWENYERLLGDGKPFRLPYGDSAPRGLRCYVRALLLIVEDLPYRRLLNEAHPLLKWILNCGNPDHLRRAQWEYLPLLYEYSSEQRRTESKKRKQELARFRQQKHRNHEKRWKKQKRQKFRAEKA